MSKKPTKKTDKDKPWNKKAQPSSYRTDFRQQNPIILIVCEGQTEELYFKSFPVLGLTIKVENRKGEAKLKLIESTQKIVKDTKTEYDQIWCVFDMDFKQGAKELADFDNAIKKALGLDYKVAYSNDAFELWFYLHFKPANAKELRTFYYEELGKVWSINYEKEGKKRAFCLKIYNLLASSQKNAIDRAEKLLNDQKDLPYNKQNPCTTVFELVRELNNNLKP